MLETEPGSVNTSSIPNSPKGLDGNYWTSETNRETLRQSCEEEWNEILEEKIVTRISVLNDLINRIPCKRCDGGVLRCNEYLRTSGSLVSKCNTCSSIESFETARLINLSNGSRRVYDIPYLQAVASRLVPGGGIGSYNRFSTILGLKSFGKTHYLNFCNTSLFSAIKRVYFEARNNIVCSAED